MKKIVLILTSIGFLITGCVSSSMTYNEKYKDKLTEAVIAWVDGGIAIQNYDIKNNKELASTCKKEVERVKKGLMDISTLDKEFLARNIKSPKLGSKHKRFFTLSITNYKSINAFNCKPEVVSVRANLYDVENITKDWVGKINSDKIKSLFKGDEKVLIWGRTFKLNFYKNNSYLNEKDVLDTLTGRIVNDLDKLALLPKKVKTLKEVEEMQAQRRLEKKKTATLSAISNIKCDKMKNKLSIGYGNKSHAMCVGNLSFTDASLVSSKQTISFLNASESTYKYKLKNSTCDGFALSYVSGSKNDSDVNFESTYKDQILKFYDNKCQIQKIDDINFLACTKENKTDYFLENSHIHEERIYMKELIQMNNTCFNKFKQYYNNKEIGNEWRTPYGTNNLGWDAFGDNEFTNSKYDIDGFDVNGWNKEKINKHTNNKYDKKGYTFDGIDKDGVNKNGFDLKKKKYIRYVSGDDFPFEIKLFKSSAKNKLFNRDYYSDVNFVKQKDGYKLVAKKIYGDKKKPEKVETYYFRSEKGKLLDFNNPKSAVFDKKLILEKKETRIFDKNGLDKDGYDINNWSPKLKKRKS